ncbi:MAG: DUF1425 domain-containing protein [Lentisphaeria bacterium]|nr:DUF1425 domain-containing protein [Lentisphaeria bacterium]
MKFFTTLMAGIAVLLVAAGCQSPKTAGQSITATIVDGDPQLATVLRVDDQRLARYVSVKSVNSAVKHDGFLQAQVEVLNNSKRDYAVQYRYLWFDANDMEIYPGKRPWQQAVLHGGESIRLQGISPYPEAKAFRVQIRPMP